MYCKKYGSKGKKDYYNMLKNKCAKYYQTTNENKPNTNNWLYVFLIITKL